MTPLFDYFVSITPGFLVFVALLATVPRDQTLLRILLHIAFFVLARDAMTRSGFWQINAGSLRFTAGPSVLLCLAALSAALCVSVFWLERQARSERRARSAKVWQVRQWRRREHHPPERRSRR